ncbi:hypothetical protein [Acidovorax sp. BLS4]|uniref:hypothetical protein n=1 Tax=Acidovorax sp. BLS4 TaxID=3273430 RepID=UPI0029436D49|nr:hypothetical protein [Paracidovorax avenae]WOI44321.1 hypothetical protein R1Z03_17515 [Paracidovorax avenae]
MSFFPGVAEDAVKPRLAAATACVVHPPGACLGAVFRTLQKSSAGLARLSCRDPSNPTRIFTATLQKLLAGALSKAPLRGLIEALMAMPFSPCLNENGNVLRRGLDKKALRGCTAPALELICPMVIFSFLKGCRHEQ